MRASGLVGLLLAFLLSCDCGGREGPPADSRSDATTPTPAPVEILEPHDLLALPKPSVRLVLRIGGPDGSRYSVALNGLDLARDANVYRSMATMPLLRGGGWLRITATPRHGAAFTICRRYACRIDAAYESRLAALLQEIESPSDRTASGAYLQLVDSPDLESVGHLCTRLLAASNGRTRLSTAMLLGRWRALDAMPYLLEALRADPESPVRLACMHALCALGPGLNPGPAEICTARHVPPGADTDLAQWLAPLIPRLRAERFPAECAE